MKLFKVADAFEKKLSPMNKAKSWAKKYIKNPYGNCFFYSSILTILFPGLTLMKGIHSKQRKEDTAHFWVENDKGEKFDPTEDQFDELGYSFEGKPVNVYKNIDFIINDPMFESLPGNVKNKILQLI